MKRLGLLVLAALFTSGIASTALAQGVTLDQYRAAETPLDGFVVTRPRTLGHLRAAAGLHLDFALAPLRGSASATGATLVDHELAAQAGIALGLLDRIVVAARLPVVLSMGGPGAAAGAPLTRDPAASGPGLSDLALSGRYRLVGEEEDVFALAMVTEATIPLAEAASSAQDLAGEAGASFTPELAAELRFLPVRITANLGARFRERALYASLRVQHELTWALAVSVDAIPDVLEVMLEGWGATPFDRFGNAVRSQVELLLGARVRPLAPLFIGLAGGAGIGDAYGNPELRVVLTAGWADVEGLPAERERARAAESEPELADEAPQDAQGTPEGEAVSPVETEAEAEAPRERVVPPGREAYGQLDRDGDRLVDAVDQCVLDREDYDEIEDADGCPEADADADQVLDVDDACPTTPGVHTDDAETRGCPARAYISERGTIVITERVEFATGSDRILRQSEAVLGDVLAILQSAEDVTRVRIEGHTDDRGRDAANLRLSTARAASVRRWLEGHGIAPERLEAWGCGELHPREPGTSTRARQANRRVEFFIVDPMPPELQLREGCVEATP